MLAIKQEGMCKVYMLSNTNMPPMTVTSKIDSAAIMDYNKHMDGVDANWLGQFPQ